jgi:hypothetical protein
MSHYWYQVAGSSESRPPLEAVRSDERYIAFSDYARQIRPYLDLFDRNAIHILSLETLIADPASSLDALCRWLGIRQCGSDLAFDTRNAGSPELHQIRPSFRRWRRLLLHWRWQALRRRHPWMRQLVRAVMYQRIRRDKTAEEAARAYLRPIHSQHVREFSSLLGRQFPEWHSGASVQDVGKVHPAIATS